VRALDLPTIDAEGLYRAISARRHPKTTARLVGIEAEVFAAYVEYEGEAFEDATALEEGDFSINEDKALRGNYARLGKVCREVREELLIGAERGMCPMCAERTASVLDHYLPRAAYPEFSILPINLVPVCWDCNFLKDKNFKENGESALSPCLLRLARGRAMPETHPWTPRLGLRSWIFRLARRRRSLLASAVAS